MDADRLQRAVSAIQSAQRVVAFTGAGISVESGIPSFRGPEGLWARYDPIILDIRYFSQYPEKAWVTIKEIFYDYFGQAQPNLAHSVLAQMETAGMLKGGVITQNIDNLHQMAGSRTVTEYHGTSHRLTCLDCGATVPYTPDLFKKMPPRCSACDGILKPDFVFFGEPIPLKAQREALAETRAADVWLVVGTTGEVAPASLLPPEAKRRGATIIEVNIEPSAYTPRITDIFLQGRAVEVMSGLWHTLGGE